MKMALPLEPSTSSASEAQVLHKPVFIFFLCWYAANLAGLFLQIDAHWMDALLLISAVATVLVGLARRLPFQNVIASTTLIILLAGSALVVSEITSIPFGPRLFTEDIGPKIFHVLPWPVPFIWLVAIISSRGVARLIFRPWRKTNYYGFYVIGLTVVLALVLDLGLEPYATVRKHFWFWRTPDSVLNWHGAPWTNFLGWAVVCLGIAVLATPWLINKNPMKQPTDYHPLIVWLLLSGYFVAANGIQKDWLAVAVCALASLLTTIFAVRGARW
jgi:uncharacterized membrane protein